MQLNAKFHDERNAKNFAIFISQRSRNDFNYLAKDKKFAVRMRWSVSCESFCISLVVDLGLKHVLTYLKGTPQLNLKIRKSANPLELPGFSDSD